MGQKSARVRNGMPLLGAVNGGISGSRCQLILKTIALPWGSYRGDRKLLRPVSTNGSISGMRNLGVLASRAAEERHRHAMLPPLPSYDRSSNSLPSAVA